MKGTSELLTDLRSVLEDFELHSISGDLRIRVISLVPAYENLRELGKSLVLNGLKMSARDRLLAYF
jgi:hypothetical protein